MDPTRYLLLMAAKRVIGKTWIIQECMTAPRRDDAKAGRANCTANEHVGQRISIQTRNARNSAMPGRLLWHGLRIGDERAGAMAGSAFAPGWAFALGWALLRAGWWLLVT
jgi:hypothetical protein